MLVTAIIFMAWAGLAAVLASSVAADSEAIGINGTCIRFWLQGMRKPRSMRGVASHLSVALPARALPRNARHATAFFFRSIFEPLLPLIRQAMINIERSGS